MKVSDREFKPYLTKEQIQASVKYLASVLNGEKLDFPIAFDWEDYRNFERYGMNLRDLNNLLVYFEEEVDLIHYIGHLLVGHYQTLLKRQIIHQLLYRPS